MAKLLLSIKPEYVNRILSGTKKYEYRKRLSRNPIDRIVIYSTHPVQRVVGEVKVIGTLSMSPSALWELTKKEAGISREKYRDYFRDYSKACAYQLGEVVSYFPPKELGEYGLTHAPQSFAYIDESAVA